MDTQRRFGKGKMLLFPVALIVAAAVFSCEGRPDGAPTSACSSLTPVHGGITAQRTSSPYSISAMKNGNKVRVRIFSAVGEEFEGFILQARSNKNKQRLVEGTFTKKDGVSKTIDCFRGKQNTLTQTSPSPKMELITEFTPTSSIDEDVIFRATIAKTFALFWTEVDSSPVRLRSESSSRSEQRDDSNSGTMYHNCFVSQGCFGLSSGCINRRDCEVLLSYRHNGDGIYFSLAGYLEPLQYMALGLSTDSQMGEDFVTECFRRDSTVIGRESWNAGKTNEQNREMSRDRYTGSFLNGLTTCTWTSKYITEAPNGRRYDFANNSYYLLLAKGPVRNERLAYHSARIATQDPVNLTLFEANDAAGVSDSVKIHGTFMITAWIGFVSVAILIARHFKSSWETSTLCGVKIWFALHRGLMIVGLLFVVVAFIVIFVHKDGWNYSTDNPHAILGCIATAFGLFQPIMAAFRPAADHPKRPIFNWLHFIVGNSAQILAVIAIFFAVSLESSGLKDSFYYVISIFVMLHLIFHLLFQVNTWTSGRKKNNEVKMLDMSSARVSNSQNNVPEKKDNVFRILLLGVYVIFLVVILLALYALIGVA